MYKQPPRFWLSLAADCHPLSPPQSAPGCCLPACPLGSDAASETPHALALPLLREAGIVPIHAELLRFLCVRVRAQDSSMSVLGSGKSCESYVDAGLGGTMLLVW